MSDTDVLKELVQKATAGDKAAFEELYRATYRSVYFTCLGLLKDEQEAQDITQDVYLAVFEQLGTLEDAGKFKPWLYRIAANKSIKRLKKKQPVLLDDEQLEDMETEENENFLPEEYALSADKRELVLEITRKVCTDVQYQTILLYYFNELSIAEIAEIMDCLEGTVKNRLSVARTKIKEGVLRYEKKSGDKLHSFAAISFLTTLFTAQMQDMPMPSVPLNFKSAFPKSTLTAKAAKTGGRVMLKSLQMKIIAGIVAGVVAAGGVTAAVVITNQKAEQTSAGGLEGSTLDVADGGNANQQAASGNGENTAGGNVETGAAETLEPTDAPHEHVYTEKITVEATCETDGEKKFTCECGDSYTEVIKAIGHVFETYVYNEDATYEADGTETVTCENCDVTDTRTAEGTMLTYTYADMSATKYATRTVNVRSLPSTDGEKIGALSTNDEITITGQCNETGWYRFEYNGQTAYVFNDYVSDNKVEVASPTVVSNEPCPYQLGVWTVETSAQGLHVYVLYTTTYGNTSEMIKSAENGEQLFYENSGGGTAFVKDMSRQASDLHLGGVYHYTYPVVKIGTYAEGTVYKMTAGIHHTNSACPNRLTGTCQPGTID